MYIIFLQFLAVFEIFYILINSIIGIFKPFILKKIIGNVLSLIIVAITYGMLTNDINIIWVVIFTGLSVFFVFLDTLNMINSFIEKQNLN